MGEPRRHSRYTYAEYVALEKYSDVKHEFVDGDIYAMAGGSTESRRIANRHCQCASESRCAGGPVACSRRICVFMSKQSASQHFRMSRSFAGRFNCIRPGPDETALNPAILVEVTSNSSEEYDLGLKREHYHTIPRLREYIIVSHREKRITVYAREGDTWTSHESTRGEQFAVPSLGTEIAVDDIYANSTIP